MSANDALKRLRKEYLAIRKNPPPFITAKPLESNILEWHYVVEGPPETPYEQGQYHGKLIFPSTYPYKPPQIQMITPNGRFQTNVPLCLSMSDFHPDTWNPAWSVASILTGLLSFMLESTPTTGSVVTTLEDKKKFAEESYSFNRKNPIFKKTFPELCKSPMPEFKVRKALTRQTASALPPVITSNSSSFRTFDLLIALIVVILCYSLMLIYW